MDDLPKVATYSADAVVWVVMTHLADAGVVRGFTVPETDPAAAREVAADLLRALGVIPVSTET